MKTFNGTINEGSNLSTTSVETIDAQPTVEQIIRVYPFVCGGVSYRIFQLPHEFGDDSHTVVVRCDTGVNDNGSGICEYIAGLVSTSGAEFRASNMINQTLGYFPDVIAAREALIRKLIDSFPNWFQYRLDEPFDGGLV